MCQPTSEICVMGRKSFGPRLFLRSGPDRKPTWYIRHHYTMYSTGLPEEMRAEAEQALRSYANGFGVPAYYSPQVTTVRKTGHIYFVTCDAPDFPIKIGFAANLARRIAALQGALPFPIILLATQRGNFNDESMLHALFGKSRLQGEWFERSPELMAHIAGIGELTEHFRALQGRQLL